MRAMSLQTCVTCGRKLLVRTDGGEAHCLNKACFTNSTAPNATLQEILNLAVDICNASSAPRVHGMCDAGTWSPRRAADLLAEGRSRESDPIECTQQEARPLKKPRSR